MNYHGELFSIVFVISNDFWIIVPRIFFTQFRVSNSTIDGIKKKKDKKVNK